MELMNYKRGTEESKTGTRLVEWVGPGTHTPLSTTFVKVPSSSAILKVCSDVPVSPRSREDDRHLKDNSVSGPT